MKRRILSPIIQNRRFSPHSIISLPVLTGVTPAGCENDPTAKHVATVSFGGADYTGETEVFAVTNAKLNHNYQFNSFEWSGSGKTAQAKLICGNHSEHVFYEDAEMSEARTPAACEDDAFIVCTAAYGEHTEDNAVTVENGRLGRLFGVR